MKHIKPKCNELLDESRKEEQKAKLFSVLKELDKTKKDIGKSICELQKKEQEFAEAHKHTLEQIKESYNALDWISNLLLETGKANLDHKDSGNNQGLSPIIADIRKNQGYSTMNNSEQQTGGNNGN